MKTNLFENAVFIRFVKVLAAGLALVYVSLALYVSAGRYISTNISEYENQLIALLNERTGLSWHIEHLNVDWRGINPVISAQNLRAIHVNKALNANGSGDAIQKISVIEVDRFSVYVDIFASVMQRQPRLYGLNATHVALLLEKQANNRITLAGIRSQQQANSRFNFVSFVDHLRYLSVPELKIKLIGAGQDHSNKIVSLPLLAARISGNEEQRVFRLREHSLNSGSGSPMPASFDLKIVSQEQFLNFSSRFTGSSKHSERLLQPLLRVFSDHWAIEHLRADFWFDKIHNNFQFIAPTLSGKISQHKNSYRFDGDIDLASNARFAKLSWHNMFVAYNEAEAQIPNGSVQTTLANNKVKSLIFSAQALGLTPVIKLVDDFDLLPEKATNILSVLQPKGTLRDIKFKLPMDYPENFQLQAQLDNVAIDPWRGAPGATGLSGSIRASAKEGVVELNAKDDFSMLFERIYRKPLNFSSVSGSVFWRVEGRRYYVWGDQLSLRSATDSAEYGGQFSVNGRTRKEDESSHLMLNIGVRNANAADLLNYIPFNAPSRLTSWANQSNLQGRVSQGAFIYNGSLNKLTPELRSINAYFNMEQAALSYYSGWPELKALNGSVTINNAVVSVAVEDSNLSGMTVSDAHVKVKAGGAEQFVELQATANGDIDGLLEFLKNMPVGGGLLAQMSSWRGSGLLRNMPVELFIPLTKNSGQQLRINALAELNSAQLLMPNYDISLENIDGDIGFNASKGLYANHLQALLWQKPVNIEIGNYSELNTEPALSNLRLQATTVVDTTKLGSWLKQPVLNFTQGETPIDLDIRSVAGDTTLRVFSELKGVAINAPEPLAKQSSKTAEFQLLWRLSEARQPMSLQIDKRLDGMLHFENGSMQNALLWLGKKDRGESVTLLPAAEDKSIVVSGAFAEFDLSIVQHLVNEYQRFVNQYTKKSVAQKNTVKNQGDEHALALRIANLQVTQLAAFEQNFDNVVVNAHSKEQRWVFDVESDQLSGRIKLPKESSTQKVNPTKNPSGGKFSAAYASMPALSENVASENRYVFLLDYLHLPDRENPVIGNNAQTDSFTTRWSIPDLEVDIESLYRNGKPLGRWHFLYTGGEKAALVHDINIDYASMLIASESDEGLLWAVNAGNEIVTTLDVDFRSDNPKHFFATVLNDEKALPLTSRRFDGSVSLSWQGAPEEIKFNQLDGDIDFVFDEGRFLNSASSATGALKILGLLNFDSLLRRIDFDFSDVYKEGLRFDDMSGGLNFDGSHVSFVNKPINVSAPGSNFTLVGDLNLDSQIIDAELIVTLPVANNLPWIAALAGGLPVAAGAFVVSKVLDKPLNKLSSAVYQVDGSINDPKLRFDRLFDDAPTAKAK